MSNAVPTPPCTSTTPGHFFAADAPSGRPYHAKKRVGLPRQSSPSRKTALDLPENPTASCTAGAPFPRTASHGEANDGKTATTATKKIVPYSCITIARLNRRRASRILLRSQGYARVIRSHIGLSFFMSCSFISINPLLQRPASVLSAPHHLPPRWRGTAARWR